jgi:prenyltransferase beta subunit
MFKRALALILVLSLIGALPVLAQDDDSPTAKAIEYLKTVQSEDGGFSNGWVPESDLATTADVLVAIVATVEGTEEDSLPDDVQNEVENLIAFMDIQVSEDKATFTGSIAKVVTALAAAGLDPADFGGHDLIEDLLATQTEEGLFGAGAFDHCLAVIALQNASVELPEGTVEALTAARNEDGGWGFMAGEASDTNTTGLCLQALALTDSSDAVEAGLAYLEAIQNDDAGWPYQSPSDFGTDSDSNSTALVIQALIASGEDLAEWNNPQDWLLTMQNDSGSFSFVAAMPDDNVLATIAVIPALEGVPLNFWAAVPETTE